MVGDWPHDAPAPVNRFSIGGPVHWWSVLSTDHMALRHSKWRVTASIKISPVWGLTVDSSQLTLVPTSKSRDTKKLRRISKIRFKYPWSVASSHCKWQRQHLKMDGFPTLKGSWPWPWIGSYCIPLCITCCPLPTAKFSLNFFGMDVRTYRRTYVHMHGWTNGHLRSALLGRLCREST